MVQTESAGTMFLLQDRSKVQIRLTKWNSLNGMHFPALIDSIGHSKWRANNPEANMKRTE